MILAANPFIALLAGAFVFLVIFLLIILVIYILYLLTLQNALKRVSVGNRTISPGNVWLMLIPIFNIIYAFILYPKISESLKNEFESRNNPQSGDYAKTLGIVNAAGGPVNIIFQFIPFLGIFTSLAIFVIWIVYWVKISGLKNQLQ